jgi:hypothetical protein
MSGAYRVRLRTVGEGPTALGEAGSFTLVTDRPTAVDGDFPSRGSGSTPIKVDVVVRSAAPEERVRELIAEVERVAEIPRAIRDATPIEVDASVERPA